MFLVIRDDQPLTLEDQENFRAFHIEASEANIRGPDRDPRFASMSEPAEDDHFWLDAAQIIAISGRAADAAWTEAFWTMLGKVEAYGFADMQTKRVKAHVVPPGAT